MNDQALLSDLILHPCFFRARVKLFTGRQRNLQLVRQTLGALIKPPSHQRYRPLFSIRSDQVPRRFDHKNVQVHKEGKLGVSPSWPHRASMELRLFHGLS